MLWKILMQTTCYEWMNAWMNRPSTTGVILGTLTYWTLVRSGKNIHVQQHKTNMINEEWNKTENDATFVAFNDMRAVTFVLPNEMADVSIAGL